MRKVKIGISKTVFRWLKMLKRGSSKVTWLSKLKLGLSLKYKVFCRGFRNMRAVYSLCFLAVGSILVLSMLSFIPIYLIYILFTIYILLIIYYIYLYCRG